MQNLNILKNNNINSSKIKNQILRYLYKSNIKLNLKHEPILSMEELDDIRNNEYIVCPRYNGTRSWIVFFRDDDNYYAVNFPKHHQNRKDILKIHPINIQVSKETYLGTVMEGIYYVNNNTRHLIIDEVYMLAGKNQLRMKKSDRLNYLANYLRTNIKINNEFQMFISRHYLIDKIELKNLYERLKSEDRIRELVFYPQVFGKKIYSYTIIETDLIDDIINTCEFRMFKTKNTDVYKLMSLDDGSSVGVAYIPDIETSHRCRDWFKAYRTKELTVVCQEDIEKERWIPIELSSYYNTDDDYETDDNDSE